MDKIKVLYAEDDVLTALEVKEKLEAKGWEVMVAGDGPEAFKKYRENNPDIVILDVDMPGYTGFEVLQLIRLNDQQTPVVIYSSLADEENLLTGYQDGANVYLVKNSSAAILVAQVQQCVGNVDTEIMTLGKEVSYELATNCLRMGDEVKKLTRLESKVFVVLCKNKNRLTKRSLLLKAGWDSDEVQNDAQLNKIINKLRELLKSQPSVWIVTNKGYGYWLKME